MVGVECCLAVVSFDNNLWETIPVPGEGSIRSLAVDGRGVVWFISSTHIGYLSRVAGEYRAVKVYNAHSDQFVRSLRTPAESISAQERTLLFGVMGVFPGSLGRSLRWPHPPWRLLTARSKSAIGTAPSMNLSMIGIFKFVRHGSL